MDVVRKMRALSPSLANLDLAAAAGAQMFCLRLEPAEDSLLIHFGDLHCLALGASHKDRAARPESRDLVLGRDRLHGLRAWLGVERRCRED